MCKQSEVGVSRGKSSRKTNKVPEYGKMKYLTALGVTPQPREEATSAQNGLALWKLTVLPMAKRRIVRSASLSQVKDILWDERKSVI